MAAHSIVSGVRLVVVRLLASCVGIDCRSLVFAQLALCFMSYPVLVGSYRGSPKTLFFLNMKCAMHDLKKN
jgi:hypothetical protein